MTLGEKEPVLNARNRTIKAILNDQTKYKDYPPDALIDSYRITRLNDEFDDGSKLYTTQSKSSWLVKPPPTDELLLMTPTELKLNGAGSELRHREHFSKIRYASELEQLHRGYIIFILANWYLIRDLIYTSEQPNTRITNKEYNFAAGEVDFTDLWINDNKNTTQNPNRPRVLNCGQADIIFNGPSGLTILELTASTVDKTLQLSKHRKGASQVIKNHNFPSGLPINTYVGQVNLENRFIEVALNANTNETIYQYDQADAVKAKTYNQAATIFNRSYTY